MDAKWVQCACVYVYASGEYQVSWSFQTFVCESQLEHEQHEGPDQELEQR